MMYSVAFQRGMQRRADPQGSYVGGHAVRQQRRAERTMRRIYAMLHRCEHGIARNLAAGPGSGRHRNKGQRRGFDCAPLSYHFKKIQRLTAVRSDTGSRLSGVDRAAAAHGIQPQHKLLGLQYKQISQPVTRNHKQKQSQ